MRPFIIEESYSFYLCCAAILLRSITFTDNDLWFV